jgi:cyclase
MLPPRVIPCLLLLDGDMVKTIRFDEPTYVGDAINIVNLFNQFEVDEICLLDIGATRSGHEPDLGLIRRLADECWVPLSYGGGIRTLEQARAVLAAGIEKVVLGSAAFEAPDLVTSVAHTFGAQAVIASVDVRRLAGSDAAEVVVRNATLPTGVAPTVYARRMAELGAGEILLNAVDRDGTMSGFDLELIRDVSAALSIPVIASGGAASREDLPKPIRAGASAVAAGSLFVFQGPSRAVLVNFPARARLEELFAAPS